MAARADVVIDLGGSSTDDIARAWAAYHRLAASTHQRPEAGGPLKTMTYSESRVHCAETLNAVVDDREEVVITRAGHEPVVIVALADYESLRS